MRFAFVSKVDETLFGKTAAVWKEQLAALSTTSDSFYDAHLEFFQKVVEGRVAMGDGAGCVAAVVEEGRDHAIALIDVAHSKSRTISPSLKLLNVVVQPDLNSAEHEPDRGELSLIAATLILGCLTMTFEEYPSKSLKIRSTFPLDSEFFGGIMATFADRDPNFLRYFSVEPQGSWLVVTKKVLPQQDE